MRATYASLAVAAVLIAAKFAAWIGTGSVALLSSLVNSLVDAAASLVTFFAVRQAAVPPDREHRFGHGKAEPLAALGQSAFLLGSALLLMAEAVRRLISPEPVENTAGRHRGHGVLDDRDDRRWSPISGMSCAAPGRWRSAPTSCTTAATF